MRNIMAITAREMRAYFVSPLAYAIIAVFLAVTGFFFYINVVNFSNICLQVGNNPAYLSQLNVNDFVMRQFFGTMAVIFLLMVPAITMRLIAEEKKTGTAELLLTAPITTLELVIGKFLGGFSVLLAMVTLALLYPLILVLMAEPDIPPILIGFVGMVMMGGAFVAIGLLFSSITENQVIAALASFGTLLILWVIHFPARWVGSSFGELLSYLSLIQHLEDFGKGVLDTTHIIYYFSVIGISLFLTQRVIESRRWR